MLEFFGGDPDDDGDALRARKVRLVSADPGAELGIAYISLTALARYYRIASDAVALDPDNLVLASSLSRLHHALFPSLQVVPAEPWQQLAELRSAIAARQRVRLTYARFWSPVIEETIIEPYWLTGTRRGWELDAASGDGLSDLRTYLLSNVREMEILDSSFEPPTDLAVVITKHRTESEVVLEVPHDTRWAVDKYAERVELITDSLDQAVLRVHLLQPVRLRVGMMLVVGGPTARVLAPDDLRSAGMEVAAEMLSRYEKDGAGESELAESET